MANTKILIIEADRDFAQELSRSLTGRGISVSVAGDGKEGLELVKQERPDLIVLCVELPAMSGYSVCNKLKKDPDLKDIPLIIMSSEATPDTFQQHKKLKTHADEYLIKPFQPQQLVDIIGGLVGLPGGGAAPAHHDGGGDVDIKLDDHAIVEEEIAIDGGQVEEEISLTEEDLGHLVQSDAHAAAPAPAHSKDGDVFREDDLKFLDSAFENIIDTPAQKPPTGVRPALKPDPKPAPAPTPAPKSAPKPAVHVEEEISLGDDLSIDDQLSKLSEPEPEEPVRAAPVVTSRPPSRVIPAVSGADPAELRSLKEQVESLRRQLDDAKRTSRPPSASATEEINRLRTEMKKKDDLLKEEMEQRHQLGDKVAELIAELGNKQDEIHRQQEEMEDKRRDADERVNTLLEQIQAMSADLDAARATAEELESKMQSAELEARGRLEETEARHNKEISQKNLHIRELEDKINDLQGTVNRLSPFEYEVGQLKDEAEALNARIREAAESLAAREGELGDLRPQLETALETASKNEERFMKAYQRVKGDAKVRDKAAKAIEIALQLLNDNKKSGEFDAGA